MDLSRVFDTISHDLLLAKLHPYGFRGYLLKLIMNYVRSRYQRNKVNEEFINREELLTDISQGSVLGPLLFSFILTICSTLFKTVVSVMER